MKKSESIIEISKALCMVGQELKTIDQNVENPFYHSKYADLAHILKIVKPILSKNGLSVVQSGNAEHEGVVTVETLLAHVSGEYIITEVFVPCITRNWDQKNNRIQERYDAQTVGSAITYGRRYAISALLNISSEEDTDGNDLINNNPPQTSQQQKPRQNNSVRNDNQTQGSPDFNQVQETLKNMNNQQAYEYKKKLLSLHPNLSDKQISALNKIFARNYDGQDK